MNAAKLFIKRLKRRISRSGVLTAMIRKGRTKQYIKQLYDDMCVVFSTPDYFGKQINMTDIMHTLESEYGIDWQKLEVHHESEQRYLTGVRKAVKDNERSRNV